MEGETRRALLIADLAGPSALTAARGDPAAGRILARPMDLAESSASAAARLLERSDDEVRFVAARPRRPLDSAPSGA